MRRFDDGQENRRGWSWAILAAVGLLTACTSTDQVAETGEGGVESRGTLPQIQRPMQQVAPKQPSVQPPTFFFPPQTPRNFAQAPPPERYIQPGIQDVFARLRAFKSKGLTEVKLNPYEPYRSPVTPPDPAHFYLRQIVVKFVEGSGEEILAVGKGMGANKKELSRKRKTPKMPSLQFMNGLSF
jgi:hypothetical protein